MVKKKRESNLSKEAQKSRFEELVKEEVNWILKRDFSDARLQFVTVIKVELNKDNSKAKLFWDTFNTKTRGDAKKCIESSAGKIRTLLAQKIKVRHVPSLEFIYDGQFEAQNKIEKILEEAKITTDN
ncbi:MAG: 30S ribosome-binding factor RbfA [Bacteriovoracaceae bacterium]